MLENPTFAETHAFRDAFLAHRAAGFLVSLRLSSGGPGTALVIPLDPFGQVLLIFEQVEQADAVAASYGEDEGLSAQVTVFGQIAEVVRRGDEGTPVHTFLVDRNAVLARLNQDWTPTPVVERPASPRPNKPRRRR